MKDLTIKRNRLDNKYTIYERVLLFGFTILFIIIALVPFITLLSGSVSQNDLVVRNGFGIFPKGFSLSAYNMVFANPKEILDSYKTSIIITTLGSVLNVLLCSMVGFSISRKSFKYRNIISFYFFFTILFNAGLIPQYIFYRNFLGIYDTYFVLIMGPCVMVPHIIILRVFYSSIPDSLYEAASIEGANQFRIFSSVATPMITQGIATVTFYSVIFYWNDPMMAMYYTESYVPLPLYLTRIQRFIEFLKYNQMIGLDFSGEEIPEDTLVFAISVVTTFPMLFLLQFFQKYFVRGLQAGAVKE